MCQHMIKRIWRLTVVVVVVVVVIVVVIVVKKEVLVPQLPELPCGDLRRSGEMRRMMLSDAKLNSSFSCASSLSHVCAYDARCLDQALSPRIDHLADFPQF